jgi:cytochrome P450
MSAQQNPLKRPPGPSAWQSLGFLFEWNSDRFSELLWMHETYGDMTRFRLGGTNVYMIANPEAIQECLVSKHKDFEKSRAYFALRLVLGNGLVTSEGDFHLRQRRMIQPAFSRDRLRGYGNAMIEFALEAREGYRAGETFDINRSMMHATLLIVAKALFGSDVKADVDRIGKALDTLMGMDAVFLNPFGPLIAKLPIRINRIRREMTATIDDVLYRMIREHRASGDTGDLLSLLLAARDEDDGTGMTDQQVRDEVITLFLAGHETTANALTWTWMLLAQHPEIEARFHEEIDTVLGSRPPGPEDFPRLTYTRQILAESMRLYPPVWSFARAAVNDTEIGGFAVPKGTQVIVSTCAVHRDARWYPEPEKFNPDRFTEAAQAARPKFSYLPFGGGRSLCIGEGFAWMEGVLVLAAIGQRWRFRLPEGHEVKLDPHITLRPKNGLPMIAVPREPASGTGEVSPENAKSPGCPFAKNIAVLSDIP